MSEWKQIDTAPAAERVLIYFESGNMYVGIRHGDVWYRDRPDEDFVNTPTHWMPLPPEPLLNEPRCDHDKMSTVNADGFCLICGESILGTAYNLLVAFPEQSETFVLGFEAGQLFETLKAGQSDDITMHAANEEVFRRIARHYGYGIEFEPAADGWSIAKFKRGTRPTLKAV